MNQPITTNSHKAASINFIAIDVETALDKRWSICQIGLAIVENGELMQTISILIQPPNNEYSPWNTKVHGITSEITKDKPLFSAIWDQLYQIIENKKLIAHNTSFDIDCLKQTLTYYRLAIPHFESDCTYTLTGQKLEDACKTYNIALHNHHSAECDAEACAKLYLKLNNGQQPLLIQPSKTPKSDGNTERHAPLNGDVLKPDLENANPNNPFYNKRVVFTGVLSKLGRNTATEIIKKMGADIDNEISNYTDYVIIGTEPSPSKLNKIAQYINEGYSIKLINEKEFLKLIN